MLTIFTVPKSFDGHIARIQRNAIGSWIRLRPACQIVLCGDEAGTREAAAELGVQVIPEVARNRFGTPLLSSVFEEAEKHAVFPLLCYVNADIVLLPDFITAVIRTAAAKRRFLMVGQRCDLDVTGELLFVDGWEAELRREVGERGALYPRDGIDYFVYPRGSVGSVPDFAVGRPGWDNWMIYQARKLRIPVVDATASVLAVHQNHDHRHVEQATGVRWEGPEADANRALLGSEDFLFTLADASHRLTSNRLDRNRGRHELKRRLHTAVILGSPALRRVSSPLRRRLGAWLRRRSESTSRR